MSYINVNSIRRKVMQSKKTLAQADSAIEKKLERNKQKFLDDFDSHPVTQELSEGPSASNSSKTLGGRGNLFGFIGFDENDNPIKNLRDFLAGNFSAKRKKVSDKKIIYTVKYPSLEKIKSVTKMPWESGRSWVEGVEKGISGLSNYLFKKSRASRSGAGVQASNQINPSSFKTIKYMTEIINKFKSNFK